MKNWYKGNLHSHTIQSDGCLTPEESVKLYKENGYDFICFSEHDQYTDLRDRFNSEDFIILPGLEASVCLIKIPDSEKTRLGIEEEDGDFIVTRFNEIREMFASSKDVSMMKTHHIHGILGNKEMQSQAGNNIFCEDEYTPIRVYINKWDGVCAAQELSDYLKMRGCFTTYNHPVWSRVDIEDVRGVTGVWAIECYNYNTVNECGEGLDTLFWDDLLRHGSDINAFASDDNHNNGLFPDSCGGFVMVKAEKLEHEDIVNGLLVGDYYSSNGAIIGDIERENECIHLRHMNAVRVNIIADGPIGSSKTILAKGEKLITDIDIEIPIKSNYIRVEIEDKDGKKAWTNAYTRSAY